MFPFASSAADLEYASRLRKFVGEEIIPVAQDLDRTGSPPLQIYRRFVERGLAETFLRGAETPRAPFLVSICHAAEQLAYGCAGIASLIILPVFLNRLVLTLLAEPLRSEFRSLVLSQPVVTAFAASERTAGSDLLALETKAELCSDGYLLNGRKEYSSNLRQAKYVIVVARTGPGRASDAMTWYLVPTDRPGVTIGERWSTLGLRAMDLSPLELNDVVVPETHRLGGEGEGISLMTNSLSQSRTGIAAMAVGIARRARDEVLSFGTTRVLYGQKLHKQQDYRFRVAAMEEDLAAARALVYVSALKHDSGSDHSKESSIAKLYAGEMVMRVTESASLMLGSVGYTRQSVVEKLLRDARHTAIVEGTEPTHKEIVFANLLRRGGY